MSQTSYSIDLDPVRVEGQLVDLAKSDTISALAEGAIPYGKLMVRGTASTQTYQDRAVLPDAAGEITDVGSVLGISVADQGREQDPAVTLPTYPDKSAVPALRRGRVWVKVEEAVSNGGAVWVRFAAEGALDELGAFGQDDGDEGSGATRAQLPSAVYRTAAGAGEFAVVEINLP